MHPNDNLYLLALLFATPLISAAPIFSGSNDIDDNGYFISTGVGAINRVPIPTPGTFHRRDVIGDVEDAASGAVHKVEGFLGGIFDKRDLKGDLNDAIDKANQAIQNIAGDVDPSYNPPDIPHLPSKRDDVFGELKNSFTDAPNDFKGVVDGIVDKRDLVGDLNGAINQANQAIGTIAGDVSQGLNPPDIPNIPSKRGIGPGFGRLPINGLPCAGIGCGTSPWVKVNEENYHKRDLVGDLNGAIDQANQAIGTIAGDVSQGLNPPDIPHIPSKRDLVGDLNCGIEHENQSIENVAGDVSQGLNPPDIPHIPSKRGFLPNLPYMGHGPVVTGDLGDPSTRPILPRDIAGDLNGAIDTANQVFDKLAGDISPKLNPPNIPHIPTKL